MTDQIITSLSQMSDEALQELRNYFELYPPSLPIANVLGYSQFVNNAISKAQFITAASAEVDGEDTITSTTYADAPTFVGPSLSGLAAGSWIVLWGGSMQVNGGQDLFAGLSVNAGTPIDAQAIECEASANVSLARGLPVTLSSTSNTLDVVYRVSGSNGTVRYRWLFALKYGS